LNTFNYQHSTPDWAGSQEFFERVQIIISDCQLPIANLGVWEGCRGASVVSNCRWVMEPQGHRDTEIAQRIAQRIAMGDRTGPRSQYGERLYLAHRKKIGDWQSTIGNHL
jgi:hypothetical protein